MYYRFGIWHIDLESFLRLKNWLPLSTLTVTLNPIPQERSQKFFRPNFFWTWRFFGPKIYLLKFFWNTLKFFFNPKFFQTKTFSDFQIFQNQNVPSLSDSLVKPTHKTRLRSKVFSLESLRIWVKSLVWWVYSRKTKFLTPQKNSS